MKVQYFLEKRARNINKLVNWAESQLTPGHRVVSYWQLTSTSDETPNYTLILAVSPPNPSPYNIYLARCNGEMVDGYFNNVLITEFLSELNEADMFYLSDYEICHFPEKWKKNMNYDPTWPQNMRSLRKMIYEGTSNTVSELYQLPVGSCIVKNSLRIKKQYDNNDRTFWGRSKFFKESPSIAYGADAYIEFVTDSDREKGGVLV